MDELQDGSHRVRLRLRLDLCINIRYSNGYSRQKEERNSAVYRSSDPHSSRFFRSRRSDNFSRRILRKDIESCVVLTKPLYRFIMPAHVSSSRASAGHVGETTFVVLELRPLILKRNFP